MIGLPKYYSAFFRDLVYEVRHEPTSHPVKALLLHTLPSGVYMDQYQLADLRKEMGLQVIVNHYLFFKLSECRDDHSSVYEIPVSPCYSFKYAQAVWCSGDLAQKQTQQKKKGHYCEVLCYSIILL